MAVNNPIKRYAKDLGIPIPEVRFGPSEKPRLNTWPAPYLPLQLENERHDEYYVILAGKVMSLDSQGFVVPAGLALQLETVLAEWAAAGAGAFDFSAANGNLATLDRYDATDVANGVINSLGVAAALGEPVVYSMIQDQGAALIAYDGANAAASSAVVLVDATGTQAISVGNHIGVAPYSMLRAASDVMSRALNDNELHPAAKVGPEASMPYDPTQLRSLAWELQNRVTALVADECLILPVVADRTGVLIEGQVAAIGANMAAFDLGGYVTFDANSDYVPASMADFAAVDADPTAAEIEKFINRRVGQVVRKNTRFSSSYLDKVKTRWESSVPGFNAIDRMPGSATGGYPWRMHTAGATLGEIQVSLLMR